MAFADYTRRIVPGVQAVFTRTAVSGGIGRFDLPRAQLLGRLWACIRGPAPTSVGTITAYASAVGYSGLVRRIRVTSNNNQDIFNMSGPGYAWIFAPYHDFPGNTLLGTQNYSAATGAGGASTARSALTSVTSTGYVNFDIVIPIALNLRDDVGLFPLQNEMTLCTFQIEWEADTTLASVLSFTATGQPTCTLYSEVFTIPPERPNQPVLNMVHRIIEEQAVVPGNGDFYYVWPRGNICLQMLHGIQNTQVIGFGLAATTEAFSRANLRANQATYVHISNPDFLDSQNTFTRLQTRQIGIVPFDYLGTSGLGSYDQLRDAINTRQLTDLASIITIANLSGTGVMYSIRRELVPVMAA